MQLVAIQTGTNLCRSIFYNNKRSITMTQNSLPHSNPDSFQERIQALHRLVTLCLRHQGGGTMPIIDFLLGMYNGIVWRPDLQLLCGRIDDNHFNDVLSVMKLYRSSRIEPHTYFDNGDEVFRTLASFTKRVKLVSNSAGKRSRS